MSLDFTKDYYLENDRVKLSPLKSSDYQLLLPFALSEPTLWQYSLQSAAGSDNMRIYIDNALTQKEKQSAYPFLVFDKLKNKIAGSTRFYDYQSTHNTTQLGYTWYGKEFWGTGLNKNCKYLMLSFAFEKLGLDRVEFRADNNNKRSIAAMKSLGCTVEGILRSNCKSRTGRIDSIVLSILKQEWINEKKEYLSQKIEK